MVKDESKSKSNEITECQKHENRITSAEYKRDGDTVTIEIVAGCEFGRVPNAGADECIDKGDTDRQTPVSNCIAYNNHYCIYCVSGYQLINTPK